MNGFRAKRHLDILPNTRMQIDDALSFYSRNQGRFPEL
jgi:hypothetical protein